MTPPQVALRVINGDGEIADVPDVEVLLQRVAELEADLENAEKELRLKRGHIRRLLEDKERDRRAYVQRELVVSIFEEWRTVTGHTRSKLTSERFDAIRARLEDGYTREQFSLAIAGGKFDPFVTVRRNGSRQRHDDIELICRDGSRFESFACRAPRFVAGGGE